MNSTLWLALALGLRHGTDPDHLTAIDGLTRIRPRATNGLLFALGHGAVVMLLAAGVGHVIAGRAAFLGPWMLILLCAVNLWKTISPAPAAAAATPVAMPSRGHGNPRRGISVSSRRHGGVPNAAAALGCPWGPGASGQREKRPIVAQPFLLGMLLAAGFETASQLSALILVDQTNPWLLGAVFSCGMILVDGLDGYLAASTIGLAATGAVNAKLASRCLGIVVVVFSFGLGGAELLGYEMNPIALPLGLALFAVVIAIRVWARGGWQPVIQE